MFDILLWVSNFAVILIYPLLLGPGAAYTYLYVLRRGNGRSIAFFWVALSTAHVVGFFLLVMTLDTGFPGPGFFACLITPVFSVLTLLILRLKSQDVEKLLGQNAVRWLKIGTLLIPALQIVIILLLVLFGPVLCETSLRSCSPF